MPTFTRRRLAAPLLALILAAAVTPAATLAQEGPRPGGRTCDMVELYNSQGRQAELEAQQRQLQAAQNALQAQARSLRNAGLPGPASGPGAAAQGVGSAIQSVRARIEQEKATQARIRARWNLSCQPTVAPLTVAGAGFTVGQPQGFAARPVNVTAAPGPANALAIAMRPTGSPPPANLQAYGR